MRMQKDILNRQDYVTKLLEIIENIADKKLGCCFAIDGQWGSGKTYILNMLQRQIEKLQSKETHDNKYFTFYYNCYFYNKKLTGRKADTEFEEYLKGWIKEKSGDFSKLSQSKGNSIHINKVKAEGSSKVYIANKQVIHNQKG